VYSFEIAFFELRIVMHSTIRYFIFILVSLLATSPVLASSELEKVISLRKTEPAKSVVLAESLWKNKADISVGTELLKSYFKAGQTERAIKFSQLLLTKINLTPEQINAVYRIHLLAMKALKRWDSLDNIIEVLQVNTPKLASQNNQSEMYRLIGKVKLAQFKLADAESYFQRAIGISVIDNLPNLAELHSEQGIAQAQQGKFPEAMQSMLTALKIFESSNNAVPVSIYNNIGGLSIYIEDWTSAIKYLNKAIDATPTNTFNKSRSYSNLGAAYLSNNDSENAYNSFQKSLEITDELGKDNPSALSNLGYLLKEQGRLEDATNIYLRVSKIYIDTGESESLGVAKKNLGDISILQGNRDKAAIYFAESYQLYQERSYRPKLIELYPVMIDNLQQLKKYSKALTLALEFKIINDEMNSVEAKEKIADLQSAVELEKRNKDLIVNEKALLDLENEQVRKDKYLLELQILQREQKNFNIVLLFTVIALSIGGFVLLKINRFKANTNKLLRENNQKIENNHIELQSLNELLSQQSLEDPLTGLKNRRYLEQYLDKDIARINRLRIDGMLRVSLIIMLDIDQFKVINDTYGHSIGDQVLCAFSDALKRCSRESDIQVRWGGEEFLWYCPDSTYSEGVILCSRVKDELSKISIPVGNKTISPTCSYGFVEFPLFGKPSEDWDLSLKIADTALYEAKSRGRNCWVGVEVLDTPSEEEREQLDVSHFLDSGYIRFS
jgi:diguanylate cyclase (GGDEF)-like protein